MKTPKISGEYMNEVCEGDWEYCTNGLEINVVRSGERRDPDNIYYAPIKYNGEYLTKPMQIEDETAQGAADKAVKFLHGLRNVINLIQ